MTISAKELTKIIRVLRKNGVKRFKNGDFEIDLEDPTTETSRSSSNPKPRASSKAEQIEKEEFVREEVSTKDDQLAMLSIEDPVQFEQMLLEGDLEDDQRSQH